MNTPWPKKIILFGDSVLFGTGASTRNLGCGRLLRRLMPNLKIIIKGKNRDTSVDGFNRLISDVFQLGKPDCVVILFGNNDCRYIDINTPTVPLPEFKKQMEKITSVLINYGITPVLVNLQPLNSELFFKTLPHMKELIQNGVSPFEWQKKYSDALGEVAGALKIPLTDIRTSLTKSQTNVMADDGLHPNDAGHQIIAEKLAATLHEVLG